MRLGLECCNAGAGKCNVGLNRLGLRRRHVPHAGKLDFTVLPASCLSEVADSTDASISGALG